MAASLLVTPLDSEKGKLLLQESRFTSLLPYFCKQVNRKYCGPCSAAICLNEMLDSFPLNDSADFVPQGMSKLLHSKERTGTLREDDILSLGEENGVFCKEDVDLQGMTLEKYGELVESLGFQSKVFHAFAVLPGSDRQCRASVSSPNEFRTVVLDHLNTLGCHVVLNFNMSVFSEDFPPNLGHFAPLGGYHAGEDRFLLLDVWPSNEVCWVKTQDLFNVMIFEDSCSCLPRGFCVIDSTDFLMSILAVDSQP